MSGAATSASVVMLPTPVGPSAPSGPDALYTGFAERAAALAASGAPIAGADALVAEIAGSGLTEAGFKPLASVIAKAAGLDAAILAKQMQAGRAALGAASQPAGMLQGAGANPDPHPAPNPLDAVLDHIARVVRQQVVCTPQDADAVALWIAGTWGFQGGPIFPRLAITSPTKRCGKSTLLGTIAALVSSPIKSDNISPSAMFRLIELRKPTLLIDEVDTFFNKNEDFRGVVNAGYERSGAIIRSVPTVDGKNFTPTAFRVFCPVALSGIGGLPDTVLDRSIIIRLQRAEKRGGQRRAPLRYRGLDALRDVLASHLAAHAATIEQATGGGCKTPLPSLTDRAQDNWEPLLAVADLAGGAWPSRAQAAALALSGGADAPSQLEMLLADVRELSTEARREAVVAYRAWIAAGRKGSRPAIYSFVRSSDLLMKLVQMEHRAWGEYGKTGRGMTPHTLARMLKKGGAELIQKRMPSNVPQVFSAGTPGIVRGYPLHVLRPIFRRYLE